MTHSCIMFRVTVWIVCLGKRGLLIILNYYGLNSMKGKESHSAVQLLEGLHVPRYETCVTAWNPDRSDGCGSGGRPWHHYRTDTKTEAEKGRVTFL